MGTGKKKEKSHKHPEASTAENGFEPYGTETASEIEWDFSSATPEAARAEARGLKGMQRADYPITEVVPPKRRNPVPVIIAFVLVLAAIAAAVFLLLPRNTASYSNLEAAIQAVIDAEKIEPELTQSDRYTNALCDSISFSVLRKNGRNSYSVEFTYPDMVSLADSYQNEQWDSETYYGKCADDVSSASVSFVTETIEIKTETKDSVLVLADVAQLNNVLTGGAYNYFIAYYGLEG